MTLTFYSENGKRFYSLSYEDHEQIVIRNEIDKQSLRTNPITIFRILDKFFKEDF